METGKFLLGALAGVAIGAVVGVLMAPDKGSETRRKIAQKGSDVTGGLKDKFAGLKNKYNDVVDGMADKLDSLTGNGHHDDSQTAMNTTGAGTQAQRTAGAAGGVGSGGSR